MKTNLTYTLFLAILMISCNKTPANDEVIEKTITNSEFNTTKFLCNISSKQDIDSCAVLACEQAGGEYTEDGCDCGEGKSFVFESGPLCLNVFNEVTSDRSVNEEHELITSSVYTEDNLYSTNIYNFDLDNYVDSFAIPNYVAPNFFNVYYLKARSKVDKLFIKRTIALPNIHIDMSFGDISPIYSVRYHSETPLSENAPYYSDIVDHIDRDFDVDESFYYSEKGCLGHCKKTMTIKSDKNLQIKRTKEMFKGVIALDYITIAKKDSKIIDVKYDLIGKTILTLNKKSKDSKSISYTLSSFSMESTGSYSENIVNNNNLSLNTTARHDWGNVVLCDNGILPSDTHSSRGANLVKGPYSNSIYGWLTNVDDQSDYFNGVVNLNHIGSGVQGAASHAKSVYQYMKSANVASISLNSCLNEFDNWAPNTFKKGFKVINYSYSDYLDQGACLANHNWNEVSKKEIAKKSLWVFAAGNQKSYLTPKTAKLCPQNIVAGNENTIIVGSSPSYSGVTNRGSKFVDIFADAPSTSTASAIISSLAANIAKEYPKLTVAQVKRAIMASAENDGLSSRAGGMVNEKLSFKAAAEINKNKNINNKDLLEEVHCNGVSFFCKVKNSWSERF